MPKVDLTRLTSLVSDTSAVTKLNNNYDAIETAIENTLSRDGESPNTLSDNLDMNSKKILNLPKAKSDTEPVRKKEFDTAVFGTATIINNTTTMRSIFDFDPLGSQISDGVTSASAALLAGLQWCMSNRGTLYLPAGKYRDNLGITSLDNYRVGSKLDPIAFGIKGDGPRTSIIFLPAGNTTGGLSFVFHGGALKKYFTGVFQNFGIQVEGTKPYSIFTCRAYGVGGAEQFKQVLMENVDIWGTDDLVPMTSKYVVDVSGTFRPILDTVNVVNADDGTYDYTNPGWTTLRLFNLDYCYGPRMTRCNGVGGRTALSLIGNTQEGLRLNNSALVHSRTGLRWLRSPNDPIPITNITSANPAVVTYSGGTNPANGDTVFLTEMSGATEFYDRDFTVQSINTVAKTFRLTDELSGADIDGTGIVPYVSGGTFKVHGNGGQQPGPVIDDTHIHASDACIDFSGVSGDLTGFGCLFSLSGTSPTNGHGFVVRLRNYDDFSINLTRMKIDSNGPNAVGIFCDARGFGQDAIVRDCWIGTGTALYGIWFSAGQQHSKVTGCRFNGTFTNNIQDDASLPTDDGVFFNEVQGDQLAWEFTSRPSGSARNPRFSLYRDSVSPANADLLAALEYLGNNSSGAKIKYGAIEGRIDDVAAGTEDGGLNFYAVTAGTETLISKLGSTAVSWTIPGTFLSGTVTPAGGTTGSGIKMSSTPNLGIFWGSGVPTLSAAKSSWYLRTDGSSTTTRFYVNTDGGTTWTAGTTAA